MNIRHKYLYDSKFTNQTLVFVRELFKFSVINAFQTMQAIISLFTDIELCHGVIYNISSILYMYQTIDTTQLKKKQLPIKMIIAHYLIESKKKNHKAVFLTQAG